MKTTQFTSFVRTILFVAATWSLGQREDILAADLDPVLVGRWPGYSGGPAGALAISGNYAYVADSAFDRTHYIQELQVIDISNPANPHPVGRCDLGGPADGYVLADGVEVSGNYAYVTGSWTTDGTNYIPGVQEVDISNPAKPSRVGTHATNGYVPGPVVVGNYAYVPGEWSTDGTNFLTGLQVFDISNPTTPQRVGGYEQGGITAVAVSGKYACIVGDGYAALGRRIYYFEVLDVSNPTLPQRVGRYDTIGTVDGVAVSGNYTFVAASLLWNGSRHSGLEVLDISNSANPQRVGGYDVNGYFEDVAVAGNSAYVSALGDWDGTNYVGGNLQVVDISGPANPGQASVLTNLSVRVFASPPVLGNYAYGKGYWFDGTNHHAGLQVIDISIPTKPSRVGGYDTIVDYVDAIAVSGSYAYMTGYGLDGTGTNSLQVLDISDPTNIRRVGRLDLRRHVGSVAVSGKYAYIAEWGLWDGGLDAGGGLQVLDISNPANPQHLGRYDGIGSEAAVAVSGQYVYVAESRVWNGNTFVGGGLLVIDVSNPDTPRRVGGNSTVAFEGAARITVAQEKFFVAAGYDGLLIYEQPPFFKSTWQSNGQLHLSWEGGAGTRLQTAARLTNPDWQNVPGSENTSTLSLPASAASGFFRLIKP